MGTPLGFEEAPGGERDAVNDLLGSIRGAAPALSDSNATGGPGAYVGAERHLVERSALRYLRASTARLAHEEARLTDAAMRLSSESS